MVKCGGGGERGMQRERKRRHFKVEFQDKNAS